MSAGGHAFPSDLVDEVLGRWAATPAPPLYERPPLPSRQQLQRLFEVAYLASLETDEGRPVRVALVATPEVDAVYRAEEPVPVSAWRLAEDRPFDLAEVRRLAGALDVDAAALWVRFPIEGDGPLSVHGVLDLGRSWADARQGFGFHGDELPHALVLRGEGPGVLEVYQGPTPVSGLAGGRLRDPGSAMEGLVGLHSLLELGRRAIIRKVVAPRLAPLRLAHEFVDAAYTNVLLGVANAIRANHHGGTIVLAEAGSPVAEGDPNLVDLKYQLRPQGAVLNERMVAMANARMRLADRQWALDAPDGEDPAKLAELRLAYAEVREATRALAEACRFVASLAGADGALVMGTDLSVVGFGAEIRMENAPRATVYEVGPNRLTGNGVLDSKEFGMRHRSAMRLAAATPQAAVLVVSQDGGVSLVFQHQGRVCFRRNLSTVGADLGVR